MRCFVSRGFSLAGTFLPSGIVSENTPTLNNATRKANLEKLCTFLACALFLIPLSASAQVPAPTIPDNGLSPASPLGIPPGASSQGTNESVGMMNGAVNLYIPLLSLPQRGGYPLYLGYVHHSNLNSLQQITNVSSSVVESDGKDFAVDHFEYVDSMASYDQPLEINLPRLQFSVEYVGDHAYTTAGAIDSVTNIFCATNFAFTDWNGNKHPFENVTTCNSRRSQLV
jgi:hypothetical protein